MILAAALSIGFGFVSPVAAQVRSYIVDSNGIGLTELVGTPGGGDSYASGINDGGQVAGGSDTAASEWRAFITSHNGAGMTDLNSVVDLPAGVVLFYAGAINNTGLVIAGGIVTGIPEPQSYALMLAGLILAGFMSRRKRLA